MTAQLIFSVAGVDAVDAIEHSPSRTNEFDVKVSYRLSTIRYKGEDSSVGVAGDPDPSSVELLDVEASSTGLHAVKANKQMNKTESNLDFGIIHLNPNIGIYLIK